MSRSGLSRWMAFGLGLGLMVAAVVALHHGSGSLGPVVARSQAEGVEADAYFYSEVGDVGEFLDDDGRYRGRNRASTGCREQGAGVGRTE